ncbi:MAG TPA: OmpA family protein, partial [Aestuariivirgaceae bacterium]|nr:OmpA family protein [Aestuariivirgaceae bacterium]
DDRNYTAEQVVEFFAQSVDLGAERGICIGTAEECGTAAAAAAAAAAGFDLMVNFELNSDELSELAKANLREFSRALDDPRLGSASFSIEGHTDATGPESYNLELSERRADAVVAFLREQGVDASRFVVKGYGQANPRSDDPFDPINRRVETRIVFQ